MIEVELELSPMIQWVRLARIPDGTSLPAFMTT